MTNGINHGSNKKDNTKTKGKTGPAKQGTEPKPAQREVGQKDRPAGK